MKSDQTKGEVLLVKFIDESIWPFLIVEDNGFLNFVDFLCNLCRQFSVPSHMKVRNPLMEFGELLQSKMKEKIKSDIKYFSTTTDIWSSMDGWKVHSHQFPCIAQLARNWLCVTATSTPSERVFSDCGLALTAKG